MREEHNPFNDVLGLTIDTLDAIGARRLAEPIDTRLIVA